MVISFYVIVLLALLNCLMCLYIFKKALLTLQLCDYRNYTYFSCFKALYKTYLKEIVLTTIITLCFSCVLACVFKDNNLSILAVIPYFMGFLAYNLHICKQKSKVNIKVTKRLIRLIIITTILYFAFCFSLLYFCVKVLSFVNYSIICVLPITLFVILPLANLILKPLENLIKFVYKQKTINKLNSFNNLIKIGITGSYGKTSTKFILCKMLSQKYNVCVSPKSYNTPMGIAKVVLNNLQPYHDVLICEMGANVKNDINKLCKMINVNYGIITAVGSSHLKTFKTMDNLKQTKYQLVSNVTKNSGTVVFNLDNEICNSFYKKATCKKLCVSTTNFGADVFALNVKFSLEWTKFTLVLPSGKINCETALVGEGNLQDILLAAALSYELGLGLDEIKCAISMLKPIPHRLEVKRLINHYIIDDAFNSNLQGAINALNVLKLFNGTKIVVTPGIVELGDLANEQNTKLGQEIAKVADVCIVVNQTNKKALLCGINGKIQVFVADTFEKAQEILTQQCSDKYCVLYENDLPDNYI